MLKLFSLQFPQEAGKFNMNENILRLTLSKHETTGLQTNFELPERRGIFPDSIEKYDRRYWTWSKLRTYDVCLSYDLIMHNTYSPKRLAAKSNAFIVITDWKRLKPKLCGLKVLLNHLWIPNDSLSTQQEE